MSVLSFKCQFVNFYANIILTTFIRVCRMPTKVRLNYNHLTRRHLQKRAAINASPVISLQTSPQLVMMWNYASRLTNRPTNSQDASRSQSVLNCHATPRCLIAFRHRTSPATLAEATTAVCMEKWAALRRRKKAGRRSLILMDSSTGHSEAREWTPMTSRWRSNARASAAGRNAIVASSFFSLLCTGFDWIIQRPLW